MRHEHGCRAQIPRARWTEHSEEIGEPFRAGDRDRLDPAGLPSREQSAGVGRRPCTAITLRVFDSGPPGLELAPKPLAATLAFEDEDRAAAQVLELGKRGESLAVGPAGWRYHFVEPPLRQCICGPRPYRGHPQAAGPGTARAHHAVSACDRGPADEYREVEFLQPPDDFGDGVGVFGGHDLDRGKEYRLSARGVDPL